MQNVGVERTQEKDTKHRERGAGTGRCKSAAETKTNRHTKPFKMHELRNEEMKTGTH